MYTAAVIYRTLGSTGERVSALGVGGWHLGQPQVDEALATRIVRTAIDRGVTFLDNCWDYHDGESERRMGRALADGYRARVYLMTKIDGRSHREATRQLDDSLRRLGVDCIDLVQHHEILRYEDPHRIFHAHGGHAALIEARQAGKLRHIGFTGHKDPHVHLYMLEVADRHGFAFDAVQMPVNLADAHYRSFSSRVVPELVRRGVGVLAMKTLASGTLPASGAVTAIECLHYALDQPTSVVITGIDRMETLDQAFEAVDTFHPLGDAGRRALVAKTATLAMDGALEPFKTTSLFDGTAQNPAWLGEDPPLPAAAPA